MEKLKAIKNRPTQKDISLVLQKYQGLKVTNDEECVLEGTIEIEDSNGDFWGKYQIKIVFPQNFPFEFPKMFETGGKIPKEGDWHIYPDGSCCTTVRLNELLVSRNGITLLRFLDEFGVPFLANHKHKELKGRYASGEYSHGMGGYWEFFQEKLNTKDLQIILRGLTLLLNGQTPERNALCFCGTGRKYKKCHMASIHELSFLPNSEIREVCRQVIAMFQALRN